MAERTYIYLVSDQTRKEVWDKAHSAEHAERYYQRLGRKSLKRERLWSIPVLLGFCLAVPATLATLSDESGAWIPIALGFAFVFLLVGLIVGQFGGFSRKASAWTALAERYGRAEREFRELLDAIDLNEVEDGEARGKLRRLAKRTEEAIELRVKSTRNWRGAVIDDLRRNPPIPEPAPPPPRPTPPPPPPEHLYLRTQNRRGDAPG